MVPNAGGHYQIYYQTSRFYALDPRGPDMTIRLRHRVASQVVSISDPDRSWLITRM
jgi:hypothetical protein